jgi:transposase
MKTYILRDSQTVEPQKSVRRPRTQPTAPTPAKGPVLFIGLDVHNDSIAVSIAPSDSTEVRRYGIIGGEHDDVLKLVKKLQAAHPGAVLKFCYEAGPRGFALCRCLRAHGLDCILVCPSKVPRKPGERVKTDRRDADQLARLFRAGELAGIYVPELADEAMRDLIRARFQVGKAQHRARQQLKMYLLRHNLRYGARRRGRRRIYGTWPKSKCPSRSSRSSLRKCSR